jgi:hypothetical protein
LTGIKQKKKLKPVVSSNFASLDLTLFHPDRRDENKRLKEFPKLIFSHNMSQIKKANIWAQAQEAVIKLNTPSDMQDFQKCINEYIKVCQELQLSQESICLINLSSILSRLMVLPGITLVTLKDEVDRLWATAMNLRAMNKFPEWDAEKADDIVQKIEDKLFRLQNKMSVTLNKNGQRSVKSFDTKASTNEDMKSRMQAVVGTQVEIAKCCKYFNGPDEACKFGDNCRFLHICHVCCPKASKLSECNHSAATHKSVSKEKK